MAKLKAANDVAPQPEEVYGYMRQNAAKLTQDREWSQYLRQLPSHKEALTNRVHAPLLAFIQWEIAKPGDLGSVEHVIVDEAQDVTPLEWLLLDEINEADAWTILAISISAVLTTRSRAGRRCWTSLPSTPKRRFGG